MNFAGKHLLIKAPRQTHDVRLSEVGNVAGGATTLAIEGTNLSKRWL